ncbi:MAG: hypothetical protein NMK33_00755 [Candidatus Cardinium sp.]|uniref:hypothetical protein n=1 Tax=Cardinium endosymbiont of Dermatophagoides farinae TaxID=2597823 RepID=UPI0011821C28|nr:hypothetical protein [Cardinium endosymbiont of Dermatophagoides farinae]TSJ81054.1 hypothetical protein FPG78_03445 [Cardinium endosymbiont of Dermatophagoides farinae]UWW97083.1 MAG: hypothetical protein NMK33_00755 [Candidatus Cardinium sp.]
MIPLSKAKRISYDSMSIGSDKEHTFSTYFDEIMKFAKDKQNKSEKQLADDLEIKSHFTLDFGFDYTTKFGLIVGINGLGITLGYDCAKYLLK